MAVWELIIEAMTAAHASGQEWLTAGEVTTAVRSSYPETNAGSIDADVRFHCINDPSKKHSPGLRYQRNARLITDDPTKRGKRYRLLTDEERDVFLSHVRDDLEYFSYVQVLEWLRNPETLLSRDEPDDLEIGPIEDESFTGVALLELHLQDYLHRNWSRHFPDWALVDNGREFQTREPSVGIIDFLCTDKNGDYIVIETKRNLPDRQAVGQLLGYMGWVAQKKAQGHQVRGVLLAGTTSDQLRMAMSAVPNLEIYLYEIAFAIRPEA